MPLTKTKILHYKSSGKLIKWNIFLSTSIQCLQKIIRYSNKMILLLKILHYVINLSPKFLLFNFIKKWGKKNSKNITIKDNPFSEIFFAKEKLSSIVLFSLIFSVCTKVYWYGNIAREITITAVLNIDD